MPQAARDQAIQLTYPGTAALAVVRLRGPGAAGFISQHFDRPVEISRCVYGNWRDDGGDPLDDVIIVGGDGCFDVNLHGGRRIVARLLEQAASAGFDIISGEPAIDAAAEDEIQSWLPRATTELGVRMLLAQPQAWRRLDPEKVDVEAILADRTLRCLLVPATVAIVGAPNVGKSTLANALYGQERAIVAEGPGTTRDWVGGLANLGGVPVVLIDTPGRRQTSDAIEREAIELSQRPVAAADLVILMIDATRPDDLPARMGLLEASEEQRTLRVANKCDLAAPPGGWLPISASTGAGVEALVKAIHRGLGVDVPGPDRAIPALCWNCQQEKLLREAGARAVSLIAHRLRNW